MFVFDGMFGCSFQVMFFGCGGDVFEIDECCGDGDVCNKFFYLYVFFYCLYQVLVFFLSMVFVIELGNCFGVLIRLRIGMMMRKKLKQQSVLNCVISVQVLVG